MNIWVLLQGFALGASMIIPIGAQNAYVLNQGIRRHYHLTTATICSVLDILFISIGVFGGGAFLAQNTTLLMATTLLGAVFLIGYGLLSLKSAFLANKQPESVSQRIKQGRYAVMLGALAVTLLNPHLYLDTLVILGAIGGQFNGQEKMDFTIGSISASFVWFFTLSMGAAKLGPTLSKPRVKQAIDLIVAVMMFAIAIMLLTELGHDYG
ncbi:LysE/ArgO family amino acid transporter [Vibrio ostreicida]|uniref:LysE/ArgO family amino acid transporter n=1 Tax=Vibrio ostreicida TaxID=526588 RepID=A0ABT8BP90_9VIBR|nr:LysE/ArgO family amino acid transporter [Vibrio ostreicida]MDN3608987.1 LysE/ArgO family amino acid transporter [Vibrio ostreicida]NPD07887.1 amino acid transporter [Vibrio ostreicida]